MMDRTIFIASRTRKDLNGLLLTLHASLLQSVDKAAGKILDPKETHVVFVQILDDRWRPAIDYPGCDEVFEILRDSFSGIFEPGVEPFRLSHRELRIDGPDAEAGMDALAGEINGSERAVCLLDLVEVSDGWLPEAFALYKRIGRNRCIPYASNPKSPAVQAWTGWTEEFAEKPCLVVPRCDLTRPRALYIPFVKRINDVLGLDCAPWSDL